MASIENIAKSILMWPQIAVAEVQNGAFLPVGAAAGVTVYVMGVPSIDMPLASMAQWYVAMGGALLAANMALASKKFSAE